VGLIVLSAAPLAAQEGDASLPPGALGRLGSPRFRVSGAVFGARFVDDGKKLLVRVQSDARSGRRDNWGTFRLLDATTGLALHRLERELNSILWGNSDPAGNYVCYPDWCLSPDGTLLAHADSSPTPKVQVRELATGKVVFEAKADSRHFNFLRFSPDGKQLAATLRRIGLTMPQDRGPAVVIRLWDLGSQKEIRDLTSPEPHDKFGADWFRFSPDGAFLAATGHVGTKAGAVRVWDVACNKLLWQIEGEDEDSRHLSRPLAFAPDGKALAIVHNGKLTLWDPATGKALKHLAKYGTPCGALDFSPDGKRVIAIADRGDFYRVRLWDVTGREIPLPIPSARGYLFAASSETLILGDRSSDSLVICDGVTGQLQRKLAVGMAQVSGEDVEHAYFKADQGMGWPMALAPDGKTLIVCDQPGQIRRFEVATGNELPAPGELSDPATTPVYAPDGKKLLAAGLGRVLLQDVRGTRAPLQLVVQAPPATTDQERPRTKPQPTTVAFSSEGKLAAAGWDHGIVAVWETDGGKRLWQATEHQGPVATLAFAPDDRTLISTGAFDGRALWWNVATGQRQRKFPNEGEDEEAIRASYRTRLLLEPRALAAYRPADDQLEEWELSSGKLRRKLKLLGEPVAFSADGQFLLAAGPSAFHLMDLRAAAERRSFGYAEWGRSVYNSQGWACFAPDGRTIAGVAGNTAVRLWDRDTATLLTTLEGHEGGVLTVAFAPDGRSLASSAGDGTILFWPTPRASDPADPLRAKDWQGAWQQLLGDDAVAATQALERLAGADGITTWLAKLPLPADDVGRLRLIELLDKIGSDEARALLKPLAAGPPDAWPTRSAKAALQSTPVLSVKPLLARAKEVDGSELPGGALARLGLLRFQQGEDVWGLRYTADGQSILAAATTTGVHGSSSTSLALWSGTTGSRQAHALVLKDAFRSRKGPVPLWTVSPDGRLLATSNITIPKATAWESPLVVREVATGKVLLKVLNDEVRTIRHLQFALASNALLTMTWRGNGQLFDLSTGRASMLAQEIDGFQMAEPRLSPDGKIFLAIGNQGDGAGGPEIRWRRLAVGEGEGEGEGELVPLPFKPVTRIANRYSEYADGGSLAIAPDSKHLALVSASAADKKPHLLLVGIEAGKVVRDFGEHQDVLDRLLFSKDGKQLAALAGRKLRRWQVDTGKELTPLEVAAGASIQFAPDGKTLAVAEPSLLRIHQCDSAKELWRLPLPPKQATRWQDQDVCGGTCAFSPDSKTLAVAQRRTIRRFDATTGKEVGAAPYQHTIHALAVARQARLVAACSSKEIQVWDAVTEAMVLQVPAWQDTTGKEVALTAVALTGGGQRLAAGASDGTVVLLDIATGKRLGPLPCHDGAVTTLQFLADDATLVSGDLECRVALWDAATGVQVGKTSLPRRPLSGLARVQPGAPYWHELLESPAFFSARALAPILSPRGHLILIPSEKELAFFELATSKPRSARFAATPQAKVVLSADSRMLVAGPDWAQHYYAASDQPLRLLDAGGAEKRVVGKFRDIRDFTLSPDGKLLAACSLGGLRLWDTATGTLKTALSGHRGVVTTLAFAPDGSTLVSAAYDGTMLLWDVATLIKAPLPAELSAGELKTLWHDLAAPDAGLATAAMHRLIDDPPRAAGLLREHLKPVAAPPDEESAKLVPDLDDARPKTRENASKVLAQLAEIAEPALQACLAAKPSLEQRRRVELLLARLSAPVTDGDRLRSLRAVEILESVATPEAINVLQTLATGAEGSSVTRQARAALRRLSLR
jgi:WD40 repeat protein